MVRGKPGEAARPVGCAKTGQVGHFVGCMETERGSGKEGLAGPGSTTSRVWAHCRIGVRKFFFFSNLFIICKLI
jgi:hypothetical protein